MLLFKHPKQLHRYLASLKAEGQTIGFVPTMGALHQGHLSLIQQSRLQSQVTVCSIFVNPTQFNDPKDFEKYPITIDQDVYLLEKTGCDILLLPSVTDIYPNGTQLPHPYQLGFIESILEGEYRPGHFQGVCQVVEQLLQIVTPNHLYLGQKDYQQCMVIEKLIELMGMSNQIMLHICPTERESDGLAMSSRNRRLSPTERQKSVCIYQTLQKIKAELNTIPIPDLKAKAQKMLTEEGFLVDYIEIAHAETLKPVENFDHNTPLVGLIAAYMGETRLIDNLLLRP